MSLPAYTKTKSSHGSRGSDGVASGLREDFSPMLATYTLDQKPLATESSVDPSSVENQENLMTSSTHFYTFLHNASHVSHTLV